MAEALFQSWDSHLLAIAAALGTGLTATSSGGGSPAVGALASLGSSSGSKLPHRILVQTDDQGIRLFASDRRGEKRRLLFEVPAGTFRASLHRYPGQILLMLFVPEHPAISLKGKWGPMRHGPIQVARTVLRLAKES